MSCCKCGSDSNIVGCMSFWCACHKTTIPQDSAYALCCGNPDEGECIACADPRGLACEYAGLTEGHLLKPRAFCARDSQP
eukprot:4335426-Amphidinium_carterae.1